MPPDFSAIAFIVCSLSGAVRVSASSRLQRLRAETIGASGSRVHVGGCLGRGSEPGGHVASGDEDQPRPLVQTDFHTPRNTSADESSIRWVFSNTSKVGLCSTAPRKSTNDLVQLGAPEALVELLRLLRRRDPDVQHDAQEREPGEQLRGVVRGPGLRSRGVDHRRGRQSASTPSTSRRRVRNGWYAVRDSYGAARRVQHDDAMRLVLEELLAADGTCPCPAHR